MILFTRRALSQRRLFVVVVLLCLIVGAVAAMHVGGHDDAGGLCSLVGLGCAALVISLVAPLLIRAVTVRLCAAVSWSLRSHGLRSKASDRPSAFGLAQLCCLRV